MLYTKLETPVSVRSLKLSNLGHDFWLSLGWVKFQGLDVDAEAKKILSNPRSGETGGLQYCTINMLLGQTKKFPDIA